MAWKIKKQSQNYAIVAIKLTKSNKIFRCFKYCIYYAINYIIHNRWQTDFKQTFLWNLEVVCILKIYDS